MTDRNLSLRFGAMSARISEQLAAQDLTADAREMAEWQRLASSVVLLAAHGILTDAERHKANSRISKLIMGRVSSVGRVEAGD